MQTEPMVEPVYSAALDAQIFDTPAQASLFALTVDASRRGLFDWSEWVARFSANRRMGTQVSGLDGYFTTWIETLSELLLEKAGIDAAEVSDMADHWRRSYLATPHGQPIELCRTLHDLPQTQSDGHHHHHHHHHHSDAMPAPKPVFVDPAR